MRISDWSSDVCSSDLVERVLGGAIAALLLAAGGLLWWQGQANNEPVPHPLVGSPPPPAVDALPEGDPDASREAPPMPGEASPQSREQKRFARDRQSTRLNHNH